MSVLLWDASGLAKRYAPEAGSDTVDTLFQEVTPSGMAATVLGYVETYSILLRKHNRGDISATAYRTAKTALRAEVINEPDFTLLSVDDAALFAGISLMERYSLNSADAGILAVFLRYAHALLSGAASCLLVAADQRLLRAAQAEGLATLDPEQVGPAEVPARLSALA